VTSSTRLKAVCGIVLLVALLVLGVLARSSPVTSGDLAVDQAAVGWRGPDATRIFLDLTAAAQEAVGLGTLAAWIGGATAVPGWWTLALSVTFLGGMQLFILGVMGTYLGRMFDEVKHRPLYIVREVDGFEEPVEPAARTIVTRGISL